MNNMRPISAEDLSQMEESYLADEKARIVRNALTNNDITKISSVFEAEALNPFMFSIDIKTMPATNQKRSGRCWIFSSLNVLREMIAKKYHIEKFELSQNFITFYDKLEKVNWFLEAVLQEVDTPFSDETMRYLMETVTNDGGQWDMMVSVVKKYGLCPKTAMPETFQSSNTQGMMRLINGRLRKFAADSKKLAATGRKEELSVLKQKCLRECYGVLCSCLGVPPKSFTFEYVDEKKKYHAVYNVTPKQFYEKYLGTDLDDYVGIINGPTEDKPFHKMYTVKYLGNVVDGNPVSYLNLPMNEFKKLIIDQLKDGSIVWFGCDAGKDINRDSGLWDDGQFDYAGTFDMDLEMSKAEMLDARHSAMNHAMVLTGVNLVKGKPNRWKIENSWGDQVAHAGYYICTDTWFDKYVFEAVVHRKYLNAKQAKALKSEPVVLQPWDPFGSLAD